LEVLAEEEEGTLALSVARQGTGLRNVKAGGELRCLRLHWCYPLPALEASLGTVGSTWRHPSAQLGGQQAGGPKFIPPCALHWWTVEY